MSGSTEVRGRRLRAVIDGVPGARVDGRVDGLRITGIAADADEVEPGALFVAIPGTSADGHAFVRRAVERGAAAVMVERPVESPGVPVVTVIEARRALAQLAAAWYGRPAERLTPIGITGSLGKTSVMTMLAEVLTEAGRDIGVIGSLGARHRGDVRTTELTTPGPLELHGLIEWMRARGAELCAMEATSHALVQHRLDGIAFAMGIFTNLVPLEHLDYHGSLRAYAEAKRRFFEHLAPGAPLVYSAADRVVRRLVRGQAVDAIGCGAASSACVRVADRSLSAEGTRLQIEIRRPLPRVGGGRVEPVGFPLEMRLLGRSNVANATLALAAGLVLGASVDAARRAFAAFPPPRRRMQVIHDGRFTVLDDTVGHPDSISAVFEVAERIRHRRLRIVYAIRGQRGSEINRRDAEAVAIWARRVPVEQLVVTSSHGDTAETDRVLPEERDAFLEELDRQDRPHAYEDTLEAAITRVIEAAEADDLVLLLGAQGMNRGAELVRDFVGPTGSRRAE